MGYFARKGSPGSSPGLKRRRLAAGGGGRGVGEGGWGRGELREEGGAGTAPGRGNLGEGTLLSIPQLASSRSLPRGRGTMSRLSGQKKAGGRAVGERTFSQQQPQTCKGLVTGPLLRLPPPD